MHHETGRRRAAEAALARRSGEDDARAARLALFDRRLSVLAPLDSLWLAWSRGCRPEPRFVAAAADALVEARLVFGGPLAEDCDALLERLLGYERHQSACHAAIASGRHSERAELLDREAELERDLRAAVARVRERLAAAARIADG